MSGMLWAAQDLRAETAALALMSVVLYELGVL